MERDISKLLAQLTLEEKASLCSGKDMWQTKAVDRLGIPSIVMTDGPHGVRRVSDIEDPVGASQAIPATCFPSAATLACSWDRDLMYKLGTALGEECQAEEVSILLGPGANIKRSPLCGRNFEYFSEDPCLSSALARKHIEGVQSQGIGTSLKHFAVNNQETRRFAINAVVEERALREIYLASFEEAVKAQPWTVMCAYNRVNGEYCSENKYLLTDVLKKEWGFEGWVVSDWGAVNERPLGVAAGLDLEMPGRKNCPGDKQIVEAVQAGTLSEEAIDRDVLRILNIVQKAADNKKTGTEYSKPEHHALARKIASECMVLLKNDDSLLPLSKSGSYAMIGAFAREPRYQGGGSSHINPHTLDILLDEVNKSAGESKITYAQGFYLDKDESSEILMAEAVHAARSADTAVLFLGLPDRWESEGFDRTHLRIPDNMISLLEEVAKVQSKIVVVLFNGSPIEMPWLGHAQAILEGYLGGQAAGGAIADILFGDSNPSGKLAETFPVRLSDNPSYLDFPGDGERVIYREGIFVGYRYYDFKEIKPQFPFGFGLSYTTFEYPFISLSRKSMKDTEELTVTVRVKNTGSCSGKEIVQLYVRDVESKAVRPRKELKGFAKVELKPGEEKEVIFILDKRSFAYYSVDLKGWHVETGDFEILIGASSQDIRLSETVHVQSTGTVRKRVTRNTVICDVLDLENGKDLLDGLSGSAAESDALGVDMSEFFRDTVLRTLTTFGFIDDEDLDRRIEAMNRELEEKYRLT